MKRTFAWWTGHECARRPNAGAVPSGRSFRTLELADVALADLRRSVELIAFDDALNALAKVDTRKAKGVELRFFGGLSEEEVADVLQVSPQTVKRDWKLAKAWLRTEMAGV